MALMEKEHKFARFEFENINAFNKAKGLWYGAYVHQTTVVVIENERRGLIFEKTNTYL